MNKRVANLILLVLLLGLGVAYSLTALSFPSTPGSANQGGYPFILGAALILLVIIDGVQTARKTKRFISVSNARVLGLTIASTLLYFWLWFQAGQFYLFTFLLLLFLLSLYGEKGRGIRKWMLSGGISLAVTVAIYLVFGQLLNIKFSM